MKQCPSCNTSYTDDTLRFCLQDGAPLVEAFATSRPHEEAETVVSNRARVPVDPTVVMERPAASVVAARSNTFAIIIVTALATLIVIGLAGAGYLLYVRHRQREDARFADDRRGQTPNINSTPSVKPSPSLTPSPTPTPAPTPAIDKDEVARAITELISNWRDETEAGNFDALLRYYADSVEYFRTPQATRALIRTDKERVFAAYDTVTIDISNLDVKVDDSGEAAAAEFDKHWLFEGDRVSEGKVRSQLKFKRINGQWLITAEKDLRVY